MNKDSVLEVRDLRTTFLTEDGYVTAVDDVSFDLFKGETLGIVGESGCGKSVTAESIMRLHDELTTTYSGSIEYRNTDLLEISADHMRSMRGNDLAMIFQDPMSSLNPVYTVGDQIAEAILIHQKLSKKAAFSAAVDLLRATGVASPESRAHDYPHQLSGGMRQRVMIAMALSCEPSLLIADEPTTALDVTVQAQILKLMFDLKERSDMSIVFITHDLGVVAEICSRVVVMYLGQVIEEGDVSSVFSAPFHPYTKGLLKSVPRLDGDRSYALPAIEGTVPPLTNIPNGCRFAPRCEYATELCRSRTPVLEDAGVGRKVRCWHYEEIMSDICPDGAADE